MPRRVFLFDAPDRFTSGAIGQPGQRSFLLQATQGQRVTTVGLEKVQVAVLAERLGQLVDALERGGLELPPTPGAMPEEGRSLDEPLIEQFRVSTLTLAWDTEDERIVVEARAMTEDDDQDDDADDADDAEGPDLMRVRITAPEGRAFAQHAVGLVAAGRPPCPLCGLPLNPQGHICPRRNGYVN